MDYRFVIQASHPRYLVARDAEDRALCDAIQTVFPLETEYALMVWNWIYIPLSYKYDVSMMADDAVHLVARMLSAEQGSERIAWPSSTFAATWDVRWSGGTTTVHAEWRSVLGGTEASLAARPAIVVPTEDFVAEWKRPLEIIDAALRGAGYAPQDIQGLERVGTVVAQIRRHGLLYRDHEPR